MLFIIRICLCKLLLLFFKFSHKLYHETIVNIAMNIGICIALNVTLCLFLHNTCAFNGLCLEYCYL